MRSRDAVDKLALTGGNAWLGSANATWLDPRTVNQSEWGVVTQDAAALTALRARFDAAWNDANTG